MWISSDFLHSQKVFKFKNEGKTLRYRGKYFLNSSTITSSNKKFFLSFVVISFHLALNISFVSQDTEPTL